MTVSRLSNPPNGNPDDQIEAVKNQANTMVAMGRPGEPREIADTMLFLASEASSYVSGQTLAVDGLMA